MACPRSKSLKLTALGIAIAIDVFSTHFGLYRDGTELRGVYTSKPETARQACLALGSKCDYPIILGNDPLYGGQ